MSRASRRIRAVAAAFWAIALLPERASANASAGTAGVDLTELSLEELANLTVTSVSKKADDRLSTAAAIHVLTQDDIRRSGATTLPELLRLVPGVEVARVDTDHWSVGVRGFGDQFSKSVLVLIDGRSVYTPLFAGVFWAIQDLPLSEIDRIEVIRGPGGTVWGANAVNGVINVITKAASETHGVRASFTGGSVDHAVGELAYGGGDGKGFDYRAYGKAFTRGPQLHEDDADFDDWSAVLVGGRADWTRPGGDTLTLQADAYTADVGQLVSVSSYSPPGIARADDPLEATGGNFLARWRRETRRAGDIQVKAYYDRTSLSAPNVDEVRNTFDLDLIHHVALPGRQDLVWGLGVRLSPSRVTPVAQSLDFDPRRRTTSIYSAFVQDEISLVPDALSLTLGAKIERHNYTGLEVQPSARLRWKVTPRQALWAAVTRAVRTPSRLERDARLVLFASADPPAFVQIDGNDAFESERLIGYEVGYRALLGPRLYVDLAAFHNDYDDLQSFGTPAFTVDLEPPPPHLTLHVPYVNGVRGSSDGFELSVDSRPTSRWQLKASYSFLDLETERKPDGVDTLDTAASYEGSSPRHGLSVHSRLDLPGGFELDQVFRHVARLPYQDIEAYESLDLRAAWRFAPGFDLAVVGQNLLAPHHAEFEHDHDPPLVVRVRRSVYAQVRWQR